MTKETIQTGVNYRPDWSLAVIVSAGGIGMAAARRLGQRHRLLLVDRDEARAEEGARGLRDEGYDAISHACDITDEAAVARLAERVAQCGPFGVLAHVAALSPSMGTAERLLSVNLTGAFLIEQALLPLVQQGTTAIFIASLAAHIGDCPEAVMVEADRALEPDLLGRIERAAGAAITASEAYRFSKRALLRLCRRRAAEWGKRGGRIVSLSPGLIASPMGALEFENSPEKHRLLPMTPVPREGTMLEIADAIEFLASDQASFVSGVDLLVDGGLSAALEHAGR
ncbi:MAG: SDR family oxidoreductase [Novosphingobium sp.]